MTAPGSPVDAMSALLDQLTGTLPATDTTPAPAPSAPAAADDSTEPSAVEPMFDDLGQFIDNYLTRIVERRVAEGATSGINWCARWWAHPEAIARLYALWREWEKSRVNDSMSHWWRDHFEPHLSSLSGEYGPFNRCGPDKHQAVKPLPRLPAPPEVLAELPDASD